MARYTDKLLTLMAGILALGLNKACFSNCHSDISSVLPTSNMEPHSNVQKPIALLDELSRDFEVAYQDAIIAISSASFTVAEHGILHRSIRNHYWTFSSLEMQSINCPT